MIIIIKKCLSKNKIEHKNWDYHPAFFHFNEYKNTFRNGKPLKWWHILRRGDQIEIVEKPKKFVGNIVDAIWSLVTLDYAGLGLALVGIVASSFIGGGKATTSTAAGSSQKEYSSSTHPELTGASNDISNSIIPVVFGKSQQTLSYGQLPYKLVGDGSSTNKLNCYFISSYANTVYSDFKLETTSINEYSVDYIDIDTSYGGSSFIGFDNCKPVNINEQLSYNDSEEINQSNTWFYEQLTTSTSIKVDFNIQFDNVDITNWSNKTFRLKINAIDDALSPIELTQDFTIASGDIVLVSGTTYTYSGTHTWAQNITKVVSSSFNPTTYTRANSTESQNELNCIYIDEEITTDDWNSSKTFNQSINYYLGTTSEVIQTSPENTIEIDVIIKFPSGLYTLTGDGTRVNRAAKIQVHYKEQGSATWLPISNATSLFVRGLDGTKNALSTSTTTVSDSVVTVNSPADLNVADQLFFRPIGFVVPSGKYNVRVRSADFADKTNYDIGYPFCDEIHFRMDEDVLNFNLLPNLNQISLVATAYRGLSGTLKKVNCITEAIIPIWNSTDWSTTAKSTNPAAIIRYLLTDTNINARAIPITYIDDDSLAEYYEWCETKGYKASGIITDEVKFLEVLNEILKNSQTGMIPMLKGKHTFVSDKEDLIPTFMFGQHNSWNFTSKPNIGEQTNAIRANYIDNIDYTTSELTKYWYNNQSNNIPESGKTDDDYLIIKKDYKYVNDKASIEMIVEYELERLQSKRNNFEFDCNLEALNMALMDRGYISNSTNMKNESTGLIKDVITGTGWLDNDTDDLVTTEPIDLENYTKVSTITGLKLYSEVEIPENSSIIIRSLDYVNQKSIINVYEVINNGNVFEKAYLKTSDNAQLIDQDRNKLIANLLTKNANCSDIIAIKPIIDYNYIRGACEIKGNNDRWHYDGDLFTLGQDTVYDCIVSDIKYNDNNTATITAREY